MSSSRSERRGEADRRRAARGGRRPDDQPGTTPLVLVVGDGRPPQGEAEAILTTLKFAVAPAPDVSEALRVVDSLHPDLIVARAADASKLRATRVPIVEYESGGSGDVDLIDRVRAAIRKRS